MSMCCLKDARIRDHFEEDADGFAPTALFRLTAQGELVSEAAPPTFSRGEGALMYSGEFCIDPLEIQIEFLKAKNAEKWLEALMLRHAERVRQVAEDLFVSAEIKEADA